MAKKIKKVRYGIVGLGNMGTGHAGNIVGANSTQFSLGAVCDIDEAKARKIGEQHDVPYFLDAQEMYDSGLIDAVIIATPHYWHPPLTVRAARAGLHVLCEKPLSVRVGTARAMIAECKKRKKVLGAMLQQRLRPVMMQMQKMVADGDLGDIFRVEMIVSSWYRNQAYYDSGEWRGTWDGEGGGVLLNQAPHSLDLFQWISGLLPETIDAKVDTRAHDIEVEDTAHIMCDFGDGRYGYIHATTAELPGFERLTVVGDAGTLMYENGKLMLGAPEMPISKHLATCKEPWGGIKSTWKEVKLRKTASESHLGVIRAFAQHLIKGTDLVADGEAAINELEISNAAYLSGYTGKQVKLPVDARKIDNLIAKLERERSTGKGGDLRKQAAKDWRKLMK